jgi:hypothetical protein
MLGPVDLIMSALLAMDVSIVVEDTGSLLTIGIHAHQ